MHCNVSLAAHLKNRRLVYYLVQNWFVTVFRDRSRAQLLGALTAGMKGPHARLNTEKERHNENSNGSHIP